MIIYVLSGVLDFAQKKLEQIMTPLDKVYMLDVSILEIFVIFVFALFKITLACCLFLTTSLLGLSF